jgi:putative FmdB family regulatory protein
MPIYEYRCSGCQRKFEQIVLRGRALEEAVCPRCGSREVERLLSPFAMAGVSRKSEESFDDDFDAPDDALGDELGGDDLGGDDLGEDELGGEGLGEDDEDELGDGGDDDDEDF